MYICNKCGEETFNPDMICDNCKPKKEEIKQVTQEKEEKEVKQKNERKDGVEYGNQDESRETTNTNLMFCPDCGKKISRSATSCPNCGHPFEQKKKEEKKVILKSGGTKAISYITTLIGYALSFKIFWIGFIIPLAWFLYFCLYVSDKDKDKYDVTYFIKLRNEFIILMILGIPLIVFL